MSGDKFWVEDRLNWLCREFGYEHFIESEVVLPADFSHIGYNKSKEAAYDVFEQVRKYMYLPYRVKLDFYTDPNRELIDNFGRALNINTYSAGQYGGLSTPTVYIEVGILGYLNAMIATMAHELSHVRLLHEGRIPDYDPDSEALTDLTSIFFGLGVFTINNVARQSHWSKEGGYISKPIASYVLAHRAWARNERKPQWITYINGEGRYWCKRSIRFLFNTRDSHFRPRPRSLSLLN